MFLATFFNLTTKSESNVLKFFSVLLWRRKDFSVFPSETSNHRLHKNMVRISLKFVYKSVTTILILKHLFAQRWKTALTIPGQIDYSLEFVYNKCCYYTNSSIVILQRISRLCNQIPWFISIGQKSLFACATFLPKLITVLLFKEYSFMFDFRFVFVIIMTYFEIFHTDIHAFFFFSQLYYLIILRCLV